MSDTIVGLRAAKIPGWSGIFADHYWFLVLTGVQDEDYETCDRWEIWQFAEQSNESSSTETYFHLARELGTARLV